METIIRAHPDQHWGNITYSQHFEDGMLINLFELIGISKPTYLDCGAHHPSIISNTKLLYDRGSLGVNVEANPNLIEAFKKERPRDVNLNIGISTSEGILDFFMYSDTSGRNTFSYSETQMLKGTLEVKSTIKIPVVTLNQIVDRHCFGVFPELLSMDIEGLDYAVLEHADFSLSSPKIVIVETRRDQTQAMIHMMHDKNFTALIRMGENLIFVLNKYLDKVLG